MDSFRLSVFSLANVNVDNSNDVVLLNSSYDSAGAAQVYTIVDCVYSIVFLLFVVFWRYKVQSVASAIDEEVTSTADYSVRVQCPLIIVALIAVFTSM